MLKRNKESLDYEKLNVGIKIGVSILKIMYALIILLAIFVLTLLLSKWRVVPFIKELLNILSPLFIGLIIAWLFDPLVTKLNKKGVGRVLGTVTVYLGFLIILFLIFKLTIPSIASQINDIVSSTPNFIAYLKDGIDGIFTNISNVSGYNLTDAKLKVYEAINNLGSSVTTDLPKSLMNIISGIVSGGINLIFGLIIGFYMLFDFKSIRKHLMSLVPRKYKKDTSNLFDELNSNLKSFINGTLLIMTILFIFQTIGLTIAGMKAPLVFGLFCAITNVIPYVGPYIGGIPTVLVGLSISPTTGILSLVSVVVCQLLESYFLQPVVMGKTMKLHPVTIMIGLLIFGHFFGILGMIVATPIISILKTVWTHFDKKYNLIGMITTEEDKNVDEDE